MKVLILKAVTVAIFLFSAVCLMKFAYLLLIAERVNDAMLFFTFGMIGAMMAVLFNYVTGQAKRGLF